MQLSLKVGGNFIDISPAGIAIQGTLVLINSGGAAGSGTDANPQAPTDPEKADPDSPNAADNSKTGQKSTPF
jgi:type VI secretion system secreted protein VgrG